MKDYAARSDYMQMMMFGASWMDTFTFIVISIKRKTVIKYYKKKN